MARTRNYKQEYARRIAKYPANRTKARGHGGTSVLGPTPERPIRALSSPERYQDYIRRHLDQLTALAHTSSGEQALGRANDRRALENKARLVLGPPPDPDRNRRQGTTVTLT